MDSGTALWQLSRKVRNEPSIAALFRDLPPSEVGAGLLNTQGGEEIASEFRLYLEHYEQRSASLSIRNPFWIDPVPVLAMLQSLCRQEDRNSDSTRPAGFSDERESLVRQLQERVRRFPRPLRLRVERLFRAAQAGTYLKE